MFLVAFLVLFIPCILLNSFLNAMEHADAVKSEHAEKLFCEYIDAHSRQTDGYYDFAGGETK
jgi:hypothetical protein